MEPKVLVGSSFLWARMELENQLYFTRSPLWIWIGGLGGGEAKLLAKDNEQLAVASPIQQLGDFRVALLVVGIPSSYNSGRIRQGRAVC